MKITKQLVELGVNVGYMPEVKVQFDGGDDPNINHPTRLVVFQSMASGMLSSAINGDDLGEKLIELVNNTADPTGGMYQMHLMRWASEICTMVCDAVLEEGYLEAQYEFMQKFARKAPELKQKFQDAADELGSKLAQLESTDAANG